MQGYKQNFLTHHINTMSKLTFTIKLCKNESINGEYGNHFFSIIGDKQRMHELLNKLINNIMNDKNSYEIKKEHIFAHKNNSYRRFSDTKDNYFLFLCQNKFNILKNKWFIAKHNFENKNNLKLLYYVNDIISSKNYFPPKLQWKPYNNKIKNKILINCFDTKEKNLDEHLYITCNKQKKYNKCNNELKRKYYDD